MQSIQKLQAILTVHADNFRILHWKSCGENFECAHQISGNYYDMLSDDVDDIAEIMLRYDINPLNIFQCIKLSINSGTNVSVSASEDYDIKAVTEKTSLIFTEILKIIREVLEEAQDPSSIGVKAYLESLYDKYDKELRYLNKRRMK